MWLIWLNFFFLIVFFFHFYKLSTITNRLDNEIYLQLRLLNPSHLNSWTQGFFLSLQMKNVNKNSSIVSKEAVMKKYSIFPWKKKKIVSKLDH